LLADPEALSLIDELFFEEHVDFAPMVAYWGDQVSVSVLRECVGVFLWGEKGGGGAAARG
jgi:hypothetical protein